MMKKILMFFAGVCLAAGAVEPDITFSFDESVNHDKPFVMLNGKRQVSMKAVIPNNVIDKNNLLTIEKIKFPDAGKITVVITKK